MSEVRIVYSEIQSAINSSNNVVKQIDSYIGKIDSVIRNPIGKLAGSDDMGYASEASRLAYDKINALVSKKSKFTTFSQSLKKISDIAKQRDKEVSNGIAGIADEVIPPRKWYQSIGDWFYNTFCVDIANSDSILRTFCDAGKWVLDKVGNALEPVRNWFKYGDGKYIYQIGKAIVGGVAAVGGAIAAIVSTIGTCGAAAPVTIPAIIACVGAVAASIGAIITVGNSVATVASNAKAISLSGNVFDDDDGDPGAARFYGGAEKISDVIKKNDLGDAGTNEFFGNVGEAIDTTKKVADVTSLVCSIASLGNVRDFRGKTPGKDVVGYSFTKENIKRNILHEMGHYASKDGFKEGSFMPSIIAKEKEKTYKIVINDVAIGNPEVMAKVFGGFKTANNVFDIVDSTEKLDDFKHKFDRGNLTLEDVLDAKDGISKLSGFSKVLKPVDKYVNKTVKNVTDLIKGINSGITNVSAGGGGGGGAW